MPTDKPDHILITAKLRKAGCVFAEEEAELLISEAKTSAELNDMVEKRVAGLRLEHILGWAEFYGQRVAVDQGVFVPRKRTEFLVEKAIALTTPKATVIDLCCGSGALGLALAKTVGDIKLYAADIDPRSVHCARHNLAAYGGNVYQGDLFAPLPHKLRGQVAIILANAPYVPTESIELLSRDTRLNEPPASYDGGSDGLHFIRRVAANAPQWLVPGGHLFVETSTIQAPEVATIFSQHGLTPKITSSDELNATVVIGTKRE